MRTRPTLTWAGPGEPLPRTGTVADVAEVVSGRRVLVLSGAGLSTESGIPDYRGESGSLRRHTPMTYGDSGDPGNGHDGTLSAVRKQNYIGAR
ncbi:NAD-dependent protein deacetylase 1, partial [Amycolatopsis sp. NPDC000740]